MLKRFIGGALFFYMVCFPGCYMLSKLPFIILLLCIFVYRVICKKFNISKPVLLIVSIIWIKGVYGIFIGILHSNGYVLNVVPINLFWPVVYLVYISLVDNEKEYLNLAKILIYSHIFIVIYISLYMLFQWFGYSFIEIYPDDLIFSIYSNQSHLTAGYINALVFTTPMLVIFLMTNYNLGFPRILLLVLLLLTFVVLIISGRRMYMLTCMIAPFFPLFHRKMLGKLTYRRTLKSVIYLLVIGGITCMILLSFVSFDGYIERFERAFDSVEEPIKFKQLSMLLKEFMNAPLLGNGLGAILYEPARYALSSSFELGYVFDLVTLGIIGCIIYYIGIILILYSIIKVVKKNHNVVLYSYYVGLIIFLIGQATNPFLSSYDFMWPLYIGLIGVNIDMLKC
ncbi:hypothetical protein DXC20_14625 [Bacteroides sp. OM08-17BH]|nr:hypothetical protein DXC20_14625 [Bacteroides sp. OM08-17BH]